MKKSYIISILSVLAISLVGCKSQSEYCTVKGSIQGVRDGAELELQDEWNKFKVVATNPEDVFANPYDGGQLKDFFLEPGTILVDVHAEDEMDMCTGATGTVLNDAFHKILAADPDAREALWEEATRDEQTTLLALVYADDFPDDLARASEIIGRLSPDQAKTYKRYISTLKKNLVRKAERAERRKQAAEEEVSLVGQHYIDMEYPNVDDIPVRLSAVVDDPAIRYVILDF